MKHIFTEMLQVEVKFTTTVEDFIAHVGPKITYCKQPLQNEFHVKSTELLFEQGFSDVEIYVQDWEDVPCFFPTNEKSTLPFDVFAASFYLLSRYEEYLPHVKDEHGRFPVEESLAFKHDFLKIPVVDIWVSRLRQALQRRFPETEFPKKETKVLSIIDVASAYAFKNKGVIRQVGGVLVDAFSLKIKRLIERFKVVFGLSKDPLLNFEMLSKWHERYQIPGIFFFLLADYSAFDKNISVNNKQFRELIKSVADFNIVSLMGSYQSENNLVVLKKERKRLLELVNRPVKRIRMRFNRINLPETYKTIVDADFNEDYTMGYAHHIGFRAGTCSKFKFYDLSLEMQTILRVNSPAVQDLAFLRYERKADIEKEILNMYQTVHSVNGKFITVFSNENFGIEHPFGTFLDIYKNVYLKICSEKG